MDFSWTPVRGLSSLQLSIPANVSFIEKSVTTCCLQVSFLLSLNSHSLCSCVFNLLQRILTAHPQITGQYHKENKLSLGGKGWRPAPYQPAPSPVPCRARATSPPTPPETRQALGRALIRVRNAGQLGTILTRPSRRIGGWGARVPAASGLTG